MIQKKKLKKFNSDKLREECGIFGISNHEDSAALVALGLHALQHRGQEGCGIVSFDGKNYHSEKRQGLVGDHFTNSEVIKKLPGKRPGTYSFPMESRMFKIFLLNAPFKASFGKIYAIIFKCPFCICF